MSKGKLVQFGIGIIMLMSVFAGCEKDKETINLNTIELNISEEGRDKSEEVKVKSEEVIGKGEEGRGKSEEIIEKNEVGKENSEDKKSDILFSDEYIELTYIEKNQSKDVNWNIYKCEVINNFDKSITMTYRGNEEKNTYNSIDINPSEKKEIFYILDNEEVKDSMFSVYLTNNIEPKLLEDYYISFEEKD